MGQSLSIDTGLTCQRPEIPSGATRVERVSIGIGGSNRICTYTTKPDIER